MLTRFEKNTVQLGLTDIVRTTQLGSDCLGHSKFSAGGEKTVRAAITLIKRELLDGPKDRPDDDPTEGSDQDSIHDD